MSFDCCRSRRIQFQPPDRRPKVSPMIASGLRRLSLIAVMTLLAAPQTMAADASPWDGDTRSAARLIAGKPFAGADKTVRAGVELKLSPGWKTYWRYPGDSGVPPRFDFSRSTNVRSVTVAWPAPHRFTDGPGFSIGYRGGVIFPLQIVPEDAAKPVDLRLDLQYAICEKVCVPVDAKSELSLGAGASSQDAAIVAAEAMVPKPASLNDGRQFTVDSVRRDPTDRKRVIVDMTAPEHFKIDLFAEGPSPDWALPLPVAIPGTPAGQRRFAFELDGIPPGTTADGAVVTLTAVAGNAAIEVKAALD